MFNRTLGEFIMNRPSKGAMMVTSVLSCAIGAIASIGIAAVIDSVSSKAKATIVNCVSKGVAE